MHSRPTRPWLGRFQCLKSSHSRCLVERSLATATLGRGGTGLNWTVYLGNIHLETSTEDLCNAIRGGILKALDTCPISIFSLSHLLTTVFTFFQVASYQGLTLNNRRLKIGWGKNSGLATPGPHMGSTAQVQPHHIGMSLPELTQAVGSKLLEMQQPESSRMLSRPFYSTKLN